MNFYIVDVFAQGKYTGNQLAVVTGAGGLSVQVMQQIAREMNFSETTFVLLDQGRDEGQGDRATDGMSLTEGQFPESGDAAHGYGVRIFTPREELPFAGHPSLGTAYVLQQQILRQRLDRVILNLPVGPITISLTYESDPSTGKPSPEPTMLWMQQPAPTFGPVFSPTEIAPILSLQPQHLDSRWPIQEVSTGLPFILVPLQSLDRLQQIRVDRERYYQLIAHTQAQALLVFCPETQHPDNHLSVRMFADALGISEDPATGSGNGCLAGYLVQHRYWGTTSISVRVEQGYAMGRPSLLWLQAQDRGEAISIQVGGQVVLVAQGQLV
jgi:trans-2,3-dihydro-3-hydroxyanthranilate isomerase